jgi:exodeoxyribonuclease V alpha subunit
MESITGTIERIKYHQVSVNSDAGNKFLSALFTYEKDGKQEQTTINGEMNTPVYGWKYNLFGEWKTHPKYGLGFTFESFEPVIAKSHEGMADYLARMVPEIGKVRARLIVDHFGDDSFTILKTDPSRLKEVAGIPPVAREKAKEFFESDNASEFDPVTYARLFDLLSPIRPPRKIFKSLLINFGSNAPQFITENPYRLLDFPGMGWDRVDRFATQILKYDRNGIERHKRSILEVLAREAERGNTKTDYPTLMVECSDMLSVQLNKDAISKLVSEMMIIYKDKYISSKSLYDAEESIARELDRLQTSDDVSYGFDISEDGFEDEQKSIPITVKAYPVSIITGVPGSGKSHSVALIVKSLYNSGIQDILILAPTGKAAKRNDEFIQQSLPGTKIPCSTIHRALGAKLSSDQEEGIPEEEARINRGRDKFQFEHNRENQLPYSYFIIDESSMADVSLAACLLEAIPDGSRLLFVGDHYQLPSVGPGAVLRDLMAAKIPSVILDKPRRNSGVIAHACYMVKEGKFPNPRVLEEASEGPSNWSHVEISDNNKILDAIRDTHVRYITKYGIEAGKTNLQVISPEKKGTLGVNNLNIMLGNVMNPQGGPIHTSKDESEATVRTGDKIVRNKNGFVDLLVDLGHDNYPDDDYQEKEYTYLNGKEYVINECYVVNGDSGDVIHIDNKSIYVMFSNPNRLCMLPKMDAKISLSYALTVHKCQGSGFPIVIMPLTDYYWNEKLNTGLYSRELVYTSLSRPSQRLITFGRLNSLYKAIGRVTIHQRKTRLADMILDRAKPEVSLS